MRIMLSILALAVLILGAAGCNANEDYGTKGGDTDPSAQKKLIEDNPNMPPQAKAAAQAQIAAHTQGGPGKAGK